MHIDATRTIGKNGGIQHLTTASAFPCIERADEIVEFLGKHAALAAWTLHNIPPHSEIAVESLLRSVYIMYANSSSASG
jgi:hypothetical protein